MANIGELPYRVPSWDSQRKLNLSLCVYVLQTTSQKEIYCRVHTGCKEKRATRAKFVVFYLLIGLVPFDVLVAIAVAVATAVARSSLLPGFINVRKRLGIRPRFW